MNRAGRPALRTARPVVSLRRGRNHWYEIRNAADSRSAEVMIYDEIGYFGVSADDLVRELNSLNVDNIDVRLNTPGGDAFDGIAIYNALRMHQAKVNVFVDAIALSAGSVIAMAGDKVTMRRASQMMIHDASGLAIGNAADMREMADLLDRLSNDIASVYMARAGGTIAEWRDRMLAETWYSASEAVAVGLADEAEDSPTEEASDDDDPDMDNSWDLSIFAYKSRHDAPAPVLPSNADTTDKEVVDFRQAFREAMSSSSRWID